MNAGQTSDQGRCLDLEERAETIGPRASTRTSRFCSTARSARLTRNFDEVLTCCYCRGTNPHHPGDPETHLDPDLRRRSTRRTSVVERVALRKLQADQGDAPDGDHTGHPGDQKAAIDKLEGTARRARTAARDGRGISFHEDRGRAASGSRCSTFELGSASRILIGVETASVAKPPATAADAQERRRKPKPIVIPEIDGDARRTRRALTAAIGWSCVIDEPMGRHDGGADFPPARGVTKDMDFKYFNPTDGPAHGRSGVDDGVMTMLDIAHEFSVERCSRPSITKITLRKAGAPAWQLGSAPERFLPGLVAPLRPGGRPVHSRRRGIRRDHDRPGESRLQAIRVLLRRCRPGQFRAAPHPRRHGTARSRRRASGRSASKTKRRNNHELQIIDGRRTEQ